MSPYSIDFLEFSPSCSTRISSQSVAVLEETYDSDCKKIKGMPHVIPYFTPFVANDMGVIEDLDKVLWDSPPSFNTFNDDFLESSYLNLFFLVWSYNFSSLCFIFFSVFPF